jgi:phage shock protein A
MFGLFRRMKQHVDARLDGMIAKVENHEALVESALRDVEASLDRTERERARAASANERLREGLAEEREAAMSWRDRAIREPVEARGVECLRRSKRAHGRADELAERLHKTATFEARLASRAEFFEQKLAEFREQKELLRARQSRTEGASEARMPGRPPAMELAELFERWETHVSESELIAGSLPLSIEMLDDEPSDETEEAALVLELRELKEKAR